MGEKRVGWSGRDAWVNVIVVDNDPAVPDVSILVQYRAVELTYIFKL